MSATKCDKNCECVQDKETLRLEIVTTCVGFDDILDETITANHGHCDSLIVVTDHSDKRTQAVAHKHGVICVQTDTFKKNGRNFNKGAAVNVGMDRFQYNGWRLHLDADILLPDSFRRMLFNHTYLDTNCLYGCDRVDVIGLEDKRSIEIPQHKHGAFTSPHQAPTSPRFVSPLHGYLPLGYFQLWHASCQKQYPYSLGTAAHDDTAFAALWPGSHRRLIPTLFVGHLCSSKPKLGENWDGHRGQKRIK